VCRKAFNMTIDPSKSVLENAYRLWKATAQKNFPKDTPDDIKRITTIHEIANKLFNALKGKKWFNKISLFSRFSKRLILRDVKRALSAHKFDLITTSKQAPAELWLFLEREKNLIQDLRPLFKKHLLHRTGVISIKAKASRWKKKVTKYHDSPRFLLASLGLATATERYPKLRPLVNRIIKPLNPKIIKDYTEWSLQGQDPAVEKGLTTLLSREDFNPQAPFNSILKSAVYEIGMQKMRNVAHDTFQTCTYYLNAAKDRVCSAANRVKNFVFYPFMTKEG
jgi:hypothetical protein